MRRVGAVLAAAMGAVATASECTRNVYTLPAGDELLVPVGTSSEVSGSCSKRGELKMNGGTGELVYCDTTWKALGGLESRLADLEAKMGGGGGGGFSLPKLTGGAAPACSSGTAGQLYFDTDEGAVQFCDGSEWGPMGSGDSGCSAGSLEGLSCSHVAAKCGITEGESYVTITGGALAGKRVYCDFHSPGGPYVRQFGTIHPKTWSSSDWQAYNKDSPEDNNYSILGDRAAMVDTSSCQNYMLKAGWDGDFKQCDSACHEVQWTQCHDMFTATTNGGDYTYIAGTAPTTCGGFNGLHNKYTDASYTCDPDTGDAIGCWWMQVVPKVYYSNYCSQGGYLQSFTGTGQCNYWHTLWMKW